MLAGHKIALDGIVPIVHPSIKIADITTEQLRDIYNGKIKSWKELGGTGLGLAIVKHLVKAHGWEMKIESTEGQGTTVHLLCPIT